MSVVVDEEDAPRPKQAKRRGAIAGARGQLKHEGSVWFECWKRGTRFAAVYYLFMAGIEMVTLGSSSTFDECLRGEILMVNVL